MNVVSMNGGKVHSGMPDDGGHPYPLCRGGGQNQMLTKFRTTEAPLSCKTCLTYAERRAARLARDAGASTYGNPEVVSAGQDAAQPASVAPVSEDSEEVLYAEEIPARLHPLIAGLIRKNKNKGEHAMANDVNTDEGRAVVEQIDANIERAASLVEAENAEGLAELAKETESLISALGGKGSIAIKKAKRDAWTAAATAPPKPKAEVNRVTQGTVVDKTYDQFEGVSELVTLGAEKLADGVRLHLKASQVAKEVAAVVFDIWTRIPTKDGRPDLKGDTDQAKKASGAMIRLAGEGFEKTYDNEQSLKRLTRSVQDQRSDVRAEWLRSLDSDTEEGAERRALMAEILDGKPDDVSASEFVASVYGTSTIGATEKKRLSYQSKNELEAGSSEGEGEGDTTTPDERVASETKRILSAIAKASPNDFESASEETKEAVREQLEAAITALKAMVMATI